jgi:K+ transporter
MFSFWMPSMSQTVPSIVGHEPSISQARAGFWGLTLGSIGVVYGDIGTSPLYAVRESVLAAVGPNAPASEAVVLGILSVARRLGWHFDIMSTSFFLSRRSLKPAARSDMPQWQDRLFIGLSRVANDATDYFQIPTGRVVEVGTQVTI